MKVQVVIIEDEQPALVRLKRLIAEYDPQFMVIAEIESIEEAMVWFSTLENPDLIFLDIICRMETPLRLCKKH